MGRNAGKLRSAPGGIQNKGDTYELTPQTVSDVAKALFLYTNKEKKFVHDGNTMNFMDEAESVVLRVAKFTDDGLGSKIAKQVVNNEYRSKYGYKLSEKQSYIIAQTALKHKLVPKHPIFDHHEPAKKKANPAPIKVPLSSTKTTVGAAVTSKHGEGVISRIITKSTGYVEVTYKNGRKAKEMAFNLMGSDGRPLRNKPKAK